MHGRRKCTGVRECANQRVKINVREDSIAAPSEEWFV